MHSCTFLLMTNPETSNVNDTAKDMFFNYSQEFNF